MASRESRFIKTTTTISSVVTNSSMQRRIGSSMFSSCQRAICSLLFLVGILLDVSLSFTTRSNQRQKILFPSLKAVAEDNLENNVGIEKSGRNSQENNSLDSSLGATTITIPPVYSRDSESMDDPCKYPSVLHHIHVRPLLSEEEATRCCQISHEHAEATQCWDHPDIDRHQSYATCDFPVEASHTLFEYLQDIGFDDRLFSELSNLYGVDREDMDYLDLFVAHYQAKDLLEDGRPKPTEKIVMDRLELHRDGSLLSFTILLNSPKDFEGGGTFFDALRDVVDPEVDDYDESTAVLHPGGAIRPLKAGHAAIHSGKILHGADTVTAGSRTVLVGFIDVDERCYRPGVLAEACTQCGRMDVAKFRFERQEKQVMASRNNKDERTGGWVPKTRRWIGGHSHLSDIWVPAFQSAIRRADPEYQRRRKLEAEDILLREILLPPEERREKEEIDFGGDISFLEEVDMSTMEELEGLE